METLLRPMGRTEFRLFVVCLLVSLIAHVALAWVATGGWSGGADDGGAAPVSRLAEEVAQAVNAATEIDTALLNRLEHSLETVPGRGWDRAVMGETLQWLSDGAGVRVREADVVRALDTDRSREGRWDIRVWLDWDSQRGARDLLVTAYLIGEGTLKSDFGSHRLWILLERSENSGRIALETMDCRLYRAGKLGAADLLHRSEWLE